MGKRMAAGHQASRRSNDDGWYDAKKDIAGET